jgi:hypothetical protein
MYRIFVLREVIKTEVKVANLKTHGSVFKFHFLKFLGTIKKMLLCTMSYIRTKILYMEME